jgi:membrane protein DedA with SNARE-associated domain
MTNLISNCPYVGILLALILGGIGLPFPEDGVLLLNGFLIAHGTIKLLPTFLVVFPLLLATDFFVFFVGRRYGKMLVQYKRFGKLISAEKLLKFEERFRRRGAWVVLFGRHILGLRTPIFLAAGITRMSVTKFLVVDAATAFSMVALFWGGTGLLGGDLIERLTAGAARIGHLALVVFLILVVGWIGYRCWKGRIEKIFFTKLKKGGSFMRSFAIVLLLMVILSVFPQSVFAASGDKTGHLFFIERSKNKNVVQYDIRLTESRNLPDARPVDAYWILENGRHEELNSIERNYAYGLVRQEKLDKDKFKVVLAAFKSWEIIVERINDSFKAVISINGIESILQKIYIKSEETRAAVPRVLYVELFGRTKEKGLPIKERIIPK